MDAMKLLGGLLKNKSMSSGLGQQLLGGLLGGGQQQQSSGGGGIAGLLGGLMGGGGSPEEKQQNRGGGGILGGLLGSVMGGGGESGGSGKGAISGLLGSVMGGGGGAPAKAEPTRAQKLSQNDQAILMIRAMVNAAKSDGRIDQEEQQNIIGKLGADVSDAEVEFLKKEFASPLDADGFAKSIPEGMETDIYVISLTAIELDTQNEARYLGQLAEGLKMDPKFCNQIHSKLGAPEIFG